MYRVGLEETGDPTLQKILVGSRQITGVMVKEVRVQTEQTRP